MIAFMTLMRKREILKISENYYKFYFLRSKKNADWLTGVQQHLS